MTSNATVGLKKMSKTEPNEWLQWITSSQTLDELRGNYDGWAETYDATVSGVWDPVPVAAAAMLAKYVNNRQSVILDVGAGTGLAGVALATFGFTNIIGMDISPAMLAKAAERDVYQSLVACSIGDESFTNLEPASGIIATGVFAENHAGPAELRTLQESVASNGVIVFTVRQSFLPEIQDVLEQPEWECIESTIMPIYDDPICLLAYQIH